MTELFDRWGNLLFHTRNVLFPVIFILLQVVFPPVAIGSLPGDVFLVIGLLSIAFGQSLRVLTIGLAYIVRGGRNRQLYADKLVTGGVFSHSRNPLYVGNISIVIGYLFVSGNTMGIILGSLAFMTIYRLIVFSEERFLTAKFSQDYIDFCSNVPRWMPRFKGLRDTIGTYVFDWPAVAVKELGTLFMSMMVPLVLISWKLSLTDSLTQNKTIILLAAVLITTAYGIARFMKKSGRIKSMR